MNQENKEESIVADTDIERLHLSRVYGRWLLVLISWLTLMPWGLWQFRETVSLCQEYCTWSAVRSGMEFNPFATLAITFCIGFLTSVLFWHSSYIIKGGLSDKEKYYFAQEVKKIRQKGEKHFLWHWLEHRKAEKE
ncbi:hypothetical protein IQ215_10025 [Cyanobacterium stanieri LEGE 03274]|uniref:Uncharacterized protein n=1 Tax=Cyanobacterium stanieri LEGE 03274 TaxID=1828756 RepID=A0ABR9V564_9CHRO|nr:hypothetical protein [Cyanobacterium stanieri]MBE9223031.1 hypothetical protein [Cyanobacterium stanieri LEGE 03274]